MDSFDYRVPFFLHPFVQRSWAFDYFHSVPKRGTNYLRKSAIIVALYWWAWFRDRSDKTRDRELVIASLIGVLVALALAQMLAIALPFNA
jgi:hypothetical protein